MNIGFLIVSGVESFIAELIKRTCFFLPVLVDNEIIGDARKAEDFAAKVKNVKLEDVRKMADIKKYSFFALVPEQS